jgi:hypothetical protein
MSDQEKFAAKLDELIKQARELGPETARRVVGMLDEARSEILGRLASAPASGYSEWQLRGLLGSIESNLREFRQRATGVIQQGQERAWRLGTDIVDEPLASIELRGVLGALDRRLLGIAQGYSADLVRGLTAEGRAKLNLALRRAVLGGQPMTEIIDQVGRAIGGEAKASIFSEIGARAATITHTELKRMTSAATQERLAQYAARSGELRETINQRRRALGLKPIETALRKQWRHVPGERFPRVRHLQMHGQTVEVDEPFLTPEPEIELRFPGDPRGPASETVNCHCFVVPAIGEEVQGPRSKVQSQEAA